MNSSVSQPESNPSLSVQEIFLAAREVTTGELRDRFLAEAVGDDQELRRRIDRMLASEDCSNPKPLSQVIGNLAVTAYDVTASPCPQSSVSIDISEHPMIGSYKLLQRLGTGGMGEVFVAEQRHPVRRTVALKLIKRGMDSKEVIARFEAERQALAMMSHPNIASVLDAGQTEDGRPYFVMELVRGIRITDYCDRHQLTVRERLGLMVTVCQAVQHAHQKGIIHRDLKPGNLLVELDDVRHVPKVIDFGVAKATNQRLTEHTLCTQFFQMIGTPLYLSPEQAQMTSMDVDTRSDVYSLGVVLYELLTGSTPFDKDTLKKADCDEMRRIIQEEEPPRPSHRVSTLKAERLSTCDERQQNGTPPRERQVERELDWIVMKALEKDRVRRYESASAMAADIERYLHNEPVEAFPPTATYRLRKFFHRNRTTFITTGLVAAALIIGTVVSLWQAYEANEARQLAVQRFDEADAQRKIAVQAAEQAEQKEEFSQQLVYAADVTLGAQAWQSGDVRRFTDLLDRHAHVEGETDRRGFEWRYLRQFGAANFHNIATQTGGSCVVRFSPDGRYLVTGRHDGTVCFRDGQSDEHLATLRGHEKRVRGLDFAPDGIRMASIGDDGMIRLWDLDEQKQIRSFRAHPNHGFRVVFVLEGRMLASCGEETSVKLWDSATGESVGEIKDCARTVERAAMDRSPDGRLCASGNPDGIAYVWDPQTHKRICQLDLGHHEGAGCAACCICFSPDGQFVAIGTNQNVIRLCNARTGEQIKTFIGHEDDIQCVTFHPSGCLLASSDIAGVIRTWPLGSAGEVVGADSACADKWPTCFQAHSARAWALDFSLDGTRLISVSNDGNVRDWSGRAPTRQHVRGTGAETNAMTFVSEGRELLIADDMNVGAWNRTTNDIRAFSETFSEIAWCVAVSPDGKTCATGHAAGVIRLWDIETGRLGMTLTGHEESIDRIAFSPDGLVLATGSWDGTAKLWGTTSGDQLAVFEMPPHCYDVAISPNGRLLACSSENDAMLYDIASGKRLHLLQGHRNSAECVAFSPDGSLLATGSEDRTIRIWNVDTGDVKQVIYAHKDEIYSLAFSPDGRTIASGDKKGTVGFSHVETGRFLFDTSVGNEKVRCLQFSPDGNSLAVTVNGTGIILLHAPRIDTTAESFTANSRRQQVSRLAHTTHILRGNDGITDTRE